MALPTSGRLTTAFAALLVLAPASAGAASWSNPVPPGLIPGAPVVEVQASAAMAEQSMRIDRTEEQMRQLNGRVEELTYQIRQLQDLIRRLQEDTEFRFQELEGGGNRPQKRSEAPAVRSAPETGDLAAAGSPPVAGDPQDAGADLPVELGNGFSIDAGEPAPGEPPQVLGTLPSGAAGAPSAGGPLDLSAIARGEDPAAASTGAASEPLLPSQLPPADTGAADAGTLAPASDPIGQQVASAVIEDDPRAQYDRAYEFVVAGNYPMAEAGFRQFLKDNGSSALAGDAHFWLGESLYAQGEFRDAADSFLATYRDYPDSKKAPDSLLKLGLSLEGLGEKDAACATYRELEKKFPSATGALLRQVSSQKTKAGC